MKRRKSRRLTKPAINREALKQNAKFAREGNKAIIAFCKEFGLNSGKAANNINVGLGEIVTHVLNDEQVDIRGIYMTGGDTMVNALRVLGAKGIELIDYVIPQENLGRIIGGKYDGLVVGKGGLTGADDTAISIVKRIFKESSTSNH